MRSVMANWKMLGDRASIGVLLDALLPLLKPFEKHEGVQVVFFPPHPFLSLVGEKLRGTPWGLGAQDVSANDPGAHTGDVGAGMLRDVGATHVLIGHSERRAQHHESNALVAAKFLKATVAGLCPVICVGETLEQRERGEHFSVMAAQYRAVMDQAILAKPVNEMFIAYEPVWAIGTGRSADVPTIAAQHAVLAEQSEEWPKPMCPQHLYGGSVNGDNAASIFSVPEVHGVLVGGASWKPADFAAIVACAANH